MSILNDLIAAVNAEPELATEFSLALVEARKRADQLAFNRKFEAEQSQRDAQEKWRRVNSLQERLTDAIGDLKDAVKLYNDELKSLQFYDVRSLNTGKPKLPSFAAIGSAESDVRRFERELAQVEGREPEWEELLQEHSIPEPEGYNDDDSDEAA